VKLLAALSLILALILNASAQDEAPALSERLTNKDVLAMVKAGLPSDIITEKIKRSRCVFNTEPSVLAELKQNGVPDEVLKAMVLAPYGKPQVAPTPKPTPEPKTEATPAQPSRRETAAEVKPPASSPAPANDAPRPDRWRGLVIDESSPADAIRVLGQPAKDTQDSPRTYPLNKRVRIDHNTPGVRRLYYERLEGVGKANLFFKDDRLLIIDLELKPGIPATTFPHVYNINFWPKVSNMEMSFEPEQYERNEGRIYPKNYPVVYYLIGITDASYVSAMVDNGGLGGMFFGSKRSKLGDDDKGGFPGKVERLQIISRRYEKAVGAGALR
jgi:hypothetical protein